MTAASVTPPNSPGQQPGSGPHTSVSGAGPASRQRPGTASGPGPQLSGLSANGPVAIVGLGNPGPGYAGNRHNVGHMVVDELSKRWGIRLGSHRTRTLVGQGRMGIPGVGAVPAQVILAKTTSFMNVSGGPVAALLAYFRVPVSQLIVIQDELDVEFGQIKLKRGGGEGGHNGLRDITRALGSAEYVRVRVGISRPPGRMDPADYVLRDFTGAQRGELPLVIADAADATELVVSEGLERAQLRFHSR